LVFRGLGVYEPPAAPDLPVHDAGSVIALLKAALQPLATDGLGFVWPFYGSGGLPVVEMPGAAGLNGFGVGRAWVRSKRAFALDRAGRFAY